MRDSASSISVITAPGIPMHAVQLVKENPNKNKQNCCCGNGFIIIIIIFKPTSVISELSCNEDTSCVSWRLLDFYLYVSKQTETSDFKHPSNIKGSLQDKLQFRLDYAEFIPVLATGP